MTACRQITCAIPWLPCEQLSYPPEHPRISWIRRRDKSDLPLPSLYYKYFLLQYSSSILSFYSLKPTFLAAVLFENFKNFGKDLLQQSSKSLIPSPSREEMAINFVVLEVNPTSSFHLLLYFWFFARLLTWHFLFPFFLSFQHSNL